MYTRIGWLTALAIPLLVVGCSGTPAPAASGVSATSAPPTSAPRATTQESLSIAETPSPRVTPPGEGVADPDGRIVFGRYTRYDDFFGPLAQLFAIDPDGSDLVQLTTYDAASPRWSPDGRTIAFTVPQPDGSWQLATIPAGGGAMHLLTTGEGMSELASWAPDGTWLAYDYSPTVGGPGFHNVLYRVDADGKNPRLLGNADTWDVQPAVSPDGTQVAFLRLNQNGEFGAIWIREVASGRERELNAAGTSVELPAWSPDGDWILYNTGDTSVRKVRSDGSGEPVVLVDSTANPRAYKASYAPDGQHILFGCNGPEGDAICIANADGSGINLIGDLPGYVEHWSDWGRAATP
jgi:Tol biopolymer transport system component